MKTNMVQKLVSETGFHGFLDRKKFMCREIHVGFYEKALFPLYCLLLTLLLVDLLPSSCSVLQSSVSCAMRVSFVSA